MAEYYSRAGVAITQDEWLREWSGDNKRVAKTTVEEADADVSTVYLGMNHAWGDGPPLIFETMVFGTSEHDQWCARYSTEEQAKAGHEAVVAWLRGEGPEPDA